MMGFRLNARSRPLILSLGIIGALARGSVACCEVDSLNLEWILRAQFTGALLSGHESQAKFNPLLEQYNLVNTSKTGTDEVSAATAFRLLQARSVGDTVVIPVEFSNYLPTIFSKDAQIKKSAILEFVIINHKIPAVLVPHVHPFAISEFYGKVLKDKVVVARLKKLYGAITPFEITRFPPESAP